ncbi:hypothetical protein KGI01_16650 [Kurthia gibsonii]|nr:hypothetical protein KGI01_16650 [Kurthia gibsonii]
MSDFWIKSSPFSKKNKKFSLVKNMEIVNSKRICYNKDIKEIKRTRREWNENRTTVF